MKSETSSRALSNPSTTTGPGRKAPSRRAFLFGSAGILPALAVAALPTDRASDKAEFHALLEAYRDAEDRYDENTMRFALSRRLSQHDTDDFLRRSDALKARALAARDRVAEFAGRMAGGSPTGVIADGSLYVFTARGILSTRMTKIVDLDGPEGGAH